MVSTGNGDVKPLPNIPDEPAKATTHPTCPPPLTVSAREHVRRLLATCLHEEKLDEIWIPCLEKALDDFVDSVSRGSWLTGAARRRWSRLQSTSGSTTPQQTSQRESGHGHHAASGSVDDTVEQKIKRAVDSLINPQGDDVGAHALDLLHERVAQSSTATPSQESNNLLLVTLAPSKVTRGFPDLGVDFDLRPHREACIFTPGQFSLPLFDDKQTNGVTMLAGFDEWKGVSLGLNYDRNVTR